MDFVQHYKGNTVMSLSALQISLYEKWELEGKWWPCFNTSVCKISVHSYVLGCIDVEWCVTSTVHVTFGWVFNRVRCVEFDGLWESKYEYVTSMHYFLYIFFACYSHAWYGKTRGTRKAVYWEPDFTYKSFVHMAGLIKKNCI